MSQLPCSSLEKEVKELKCMVYKEFVYHYSPVFKAAFNSQSIEGNPQIYHIEAVAHERTSTCLAP